MMKYIFLVITVCLTVFSCKKDKEVNEEALKIPIEFSVYRFDREFDEASPDELPQLKEKYPYMFSKQINDSIWIEKMNDTLLHQINDEVLKVFPNFTEQGNDLELLFKHVKYNFPEFKSPKVVTVTDYVDYNNKILIANDIMLISLDTYLGLEHKFYQSIPKYISKNLDKKQLVSDAAAVYAKQLTPKQLGRTFLAQIVYEGKLLFLMDQFVPFVSDAQKIGYTEDEYVWSKANESEIWRYFIEREMLFSTDTKLKSRFINPAPFSKFYLELDNDSPGMLGRYLGWQIVKQFMGNNEMSLRDMLQLDAESIYERAKFKPKK